MPNETEKPYTANSNRIVFRIDDELFAQLQKRCRDGHSVSLQGREDLTRYYALLAQKANELAGLFTLAEVMLMCDSVNGTMFEPHTLGLLRLNIYDSIQLDKLDQKWETDGDELLEKLAHLSPEGTAALVDVLERFWAAVSRGEPMEHEPETFKKLGLEVLPSPPRYFRAGDPVGVKPLAP